MENVLVTFDIDGTLMICKDGYFHRHSFKVALNSIAGIDQEITDYLDVPLAGVSDMYIAHCACRKIHNVDPVDSEWLKLFMKETENAFLDLFDGDLDLMPGIKEALQELSEMTNVTIGVCSGNFPAIGWRKLEMAGLKEYFKDGIAGWGLSTSRKDILRSAIEQGESIKGCKFDRIIHVGDAPQDAQAAIDNSVIGVGVLTSRHPFKAEDFPKPCFVLKNLAENKNEFLQIVKTGKLE